jgi:hypothetical protein
MKLVHLVMFATAVLVLRSICAAQSSPKPENATAAILRVFETHDIVMLGELHGNKQEHEWLRLLVATPEFADRVDDIVMEFGNSLYQKSVDEYVSGKDVPLERVQKAWGDIVGALGAPSPVYPALYRAVREANIKRPAKHQMRIVCGSPYIDWEKIRDRNDVLPYLSHRDDWYAQVVKDEVLAKHHRALLIMGSWHFLRNFLLNQELSPIEQQLRQAGAKTYVIFPGMNPTGGYERGLDYVDPRFNSWPAPAILADSWADTADALLYLGPRDSLTGVSIPRAELEGTPYGKELERRTLIEAGERLDRFLSNKEEEPQFPPPNDTPVPSLPLATPPSLPLGTPVPLPPRPPSQ